MDAYLIKWFSVTHEKYLHVCNLIFAYVYLIIGILHLIRRLMLFMRSEAKRKKRRTVDRYKNNLKTLERMKKKEKSWLRRLMAPMIKSIPTATMAFSAISSILYIILTAVFDEYSPPPVTSYVQLLALVPLIGLLHFTKSLESLTRYIIQTFKPLL